MIRSRLSKKVLLSLLILIVVCFSIVAYKYHSYNWDSFAQEYICSFNCELVYLESYEDSSSGSTIYRFQTDDDLQILFDVRCFWGNELLPFGFELPVKKAKAVDNFAEQICAYVSENDGVYYIEGKSIEDISAYVLEILQRCETLLQEYGIENVTPSISFTLISADKSYTFKYGNTNEDLLFDKLIELLYE